MAALNLLNYLMSEVPKMVAPLQRLLEAEIRAGNRIVEVSSWPAKCRLLVILEGRLRTNEAVPLGVTFHELQSPHYWHAEFRYEGGIEVLACKN
jgi:hypothetical protein